MTNGTGTETWEARSWILVVDDDEDILEAIHTVLGRHGFRTVVTSNAQTALRILRRSPPPAAIVVDLRMPFMNGADLVRAIRNKPALSDMRIIGLSGDEDGRSIADENPRMWVIRSAAPFATAISRANPMIEPPSTA